MKNSKGEDTEVADLTVLDRPSKPQGPLAVSYPLHHYCNTVHLYEFSSKFMKSTICSLENETNFLKEIVGLFMDCL